MRRLTTPARCAFRRALATALAIAALAGALLPATAGAHSLTSSTIAVTIDERAVDATITLPLKTLDTAMGTDYASDPDISGDVDEIEAYLAGHLSATATDGTVWTASFDDAERETIEGVDSLSVDVSFATGDSSTEAFSLDYDGIIEAVDGHEAVVVLTDSAGDISTAGVLDAEHQALTITDAAQTTAVGDMIRHGYHHVLEGADHLLFLLALLLPAPLVAAAARWRRGPGVVSTTKAVLRVVSAFTLGHSLTLIASALGWVTVPSRPVEILIAVSVGVAAVHAIRPLARRGEVAIAVGFGLVHGLAFARILSDLGLDGSASLLSLLAFNVGIELAQLTCVALVLPSLYVLSRTRFYPAFRIAGATFGLAAATAWALDRLGALDNPFGVVEDAAVAHLSSIAMLLAGLAILAPLLERPPRAASTGAAGA